MSPSFTLPFILLLACSERRGALWDDLVPPVAEDRDPVFSGYFQAYRWSAFYGETESYADVDEYWYDIDARFTEEPYLYAIPAHDAEPQCWSVTRESPQPTNLDLGEMLTAMVGDEPHKLVQRGWGDNNIFYSLENRSNEDNPLAALDGGATPFGWADHPERVPAVEPFEDDLAIMRALASVTRTGSGEIPVNTPTLPSRLMLLLVHAGDYGRRCVWCDTPDDGHLYIDLELLGVEDLSSVYSLGIERTIATEINDEALGKIKLGTSIYLDSFE